MTSYHIRLEGDTLKVDFAKNGNGEPVPSDGDQIVRDVTARLQEMKASGEMRGGNLLKIDGRISVLASYTLSHEVAHLYRAIAVSDTRLGAYVVTLSTAPEYPVGSRIDFQTGEVKQVAAISEDCPSFLIDWEDNVLNARINNAVKADGDRIVLDAETQLEKLIRSRQLPGGQQLLIRGRATVLASFAIAHQLAHLYSSIAVFDPKQGDGSFDRYVVVMSHGKDYQIGDPIDIAREALPAVKVVLCGPPNTGKTVLRDGLKAAIFNLDRAPADFYTISGCPDGDGAWYSETMANYPELARQLKEEYKAKFTLEFARSKAREIKVIKNSLLLFDVGGKIPSQENQIIMSEATHAVILAKNEADVAAWQEFCDKQLSQSIPVIAILYSDLDGEKDEIISQSPVSIGKVHRLVRGQDISSRPMVKALAELIVNLALENSAIVAQTF